MTDGSADFTLTVVIPMHNAAATVRRALESVNAQTSPVARIVVVDDASTDGSAELVRAANLSTVELVTAEQNIGVGAARNLGARHADGEWLAFLDADDRWEPEFVKQVAAAIDELGADYASVGGSRARAAHGGTTVQRRLLAGDASYRDLTDDFWRVALHFRPIHSSSAVIRRSLFESVGGFPENMRSGEDTCLWLRLWLHGRFCFVDQPLFESAAIEGGLSRERIEYVDVRRGIACMSETLLEAVRSRRRGSGWLAVWCASRLIRLHSRWLLGRLRRRLAVSSEGC